jgi:hypothetical protein
MAERPTPSPENSAESNAGYTAFMARARRELENRPEYREVVKWYAERVVSLPEMRLSKTPVTGKGGWTKEMTNDGEVSQINSGFFTFEGDDVDTGLTKADGTKIGWNQGGIKQTETPVTIPTPDGAISMNASGFVGIIRDPDGNILLSVGQEPYAQSEKKALVRTPYQTSAKKLQGLIEGNTDLDPGLAKTMHMLSRGEKTPAQMFADGTFTAFPLAPADPNRIQATNIGFAHVVRDRDIHQKLVEDKKMRWCSPTEAKALTRAGLVNGHTAAAILSVL